MPFEIGHAPKGGQVISSWGMSAIYFWRGVSHPRVNSGQLRCELEAPSGQNQLNARNFGWCGKLEPSMQRYQIRILRPDGRTTLITDASFWSDSAAFCSAKKLARGRDFEVRCEMGSAVRDGLRALHILTAKS